MKVPKPLVWLYNQWMRLGKLLEKVMSPIILTALWLVAFGIYGIIAMIVRLFRREEPVTSYWKPIAEDYEGSLLRQF